MSKISRRKYLKYLALAGVGAAAGGIGAYEILAGGHSTGAQTSLTSTYVPPANSTPDYAEFMKWLASVSRPYTGESLAISLENEFTPLAIQQLDLDFFNATSINDNYEIKSYALHLEDIAAMNQTHAPSYDIFSLDYQDIGSFNNLVLSPTQLAEMYPDITYENLNPDDFLSVPLSLCATYPPASPGESVSSSIGTSDMLYIPFDMSTMIQYYRNDLYQSAGISPASTWTEYLSDAKKFMKSQSVFGTVNEASPDISCVFEFMNFLASYGGNLWSVNGNEITSTLDSAAALNALETYVSLQPYSDPASFTYTWEEISTDLLHNIGAAALEFQGFDSWMDDPNRSYVVNKINYAPVPAGPSGSFSLYGGSGVGISRYSKHPEAAWLWLQWATALGTQEMGLLGYFRAYPSRKSVFNDSSIQQAVQTNSYRAIRVTKGVWDSGQIATLLPFPKWTDVLGDIAFAINQAWKGVETPQAALSSAIQKIDSWGTLTF